MEVNVYVGNCLNNRDSDGKVIVESINGGPDFHLTDAELAEYFVKVDA